MAVIPLLDFKNLLVPPMATNQIPWSKGYFEHLENRPLKDREILGQHYFKSHARGKVFDEYGCEVLNPCGPVGEFGLQSYRTIDDKISEALEYPLSDQT